LWIDENGTPCSDRSRRYIIDIEQGKEATLIALGVFIGKKFLQRYLRIVLGKNAYYIPSGL